MFDGHLSGSGLEASAPNNYDIVIAMDIGNAGWCNKSEVTLKELPLKVFLLMIAVIFDN